MEQPRTECNFGEQQRGNVESQSLNLPIRAPFPGNTGELSDVLKCMAIECEAVWPAQVLN